MNIFLKFLAENNVLRWLVEILSFVIIFGGWLVIMILSFTKQYYKNAKAGDRCKFFGESGEKLQGYIISRHDDKLKIHSDGRMYKRDINNTFPI